MRALRGVVPDNAQAGLTPAMTGRGLFLACQCVPTHDLEVALADEVIERIEATVICIERLNEEIVEVRLRPASPFAYLPASFCVCSWMLTHPATIRSPAFPRWTMI